MGQVAVSVKEYGVSSMTVAGVMRPSSMAEDEERILRPAEEALLRNSAK